MVPGSKSSQEDKVPKDKKLPKVDKAPKDDQSSKSDKSDEDNKPADDFNFSAAEVKALKQMRGFLVLAGVLAKVCKCLAKDQDLTNRKSEIDKEHTGFDSKSDLDGHLKKPLLLKEERDEVKAMEKTMKVAINRLKDNVFLNRKGEDVERFTNTTEGKMIEESVEEQVNVVWDTTTVSLLSCRDVSFIPRAKGDDSD